MIALSEYLKPLEESINSLPFGDLRLEKYFFLCYCSIRHNSITTSIQVYKLNLPKNIHIIHVFSHVQFIYLSHYGPKQSFFECATNFTIFFSHELLKQALDQQEMQKKIRLFKVQLIVKLSIDTYQIFMPYAYIQSKLCYV